jgi:putative RNA 2'-phosphotransferase
MDESRLVQLSKFLSFILRHHLEVIGLRLNEGGWAKVDELLAGAKKVGRHIRRERLLSVVE